MSEALMVYDEPEPEATDLMPVSMGATFKAYRHMQKEIDDSMPDQIMTISGRQFRKRGYWRAVRAAFKLQVECVSENRVQQGEDWGYSVLYRAKGSNGMSADGDGTCMASEKTVYQKDWSTKPARYVLDGNGNRVPDRDKTREAQTEHNVRSHAHTRAFNRAVSNLVGFGEVSAEEVEREDPPHVTIDVQSAVAHVAASHDMNGQTVAPAASGLQVKSVRELASKTTGKKFWAVKLSDGREATTNDEAIAAVATAVMQDGSGVNVTLKPWSNDPTKFNLNGIVRSR